MSQLLCILVILTCGIVLAFILFLKPCMYHEFTVSVSSLAGEFTYVPQGSTIYINCTGESGQTPAWSVRLTETALYLNQFSNPSNVVVLNSRGFYEINLPSDGSDQNVVQLLVNSTAHQNNRTLVRCADVASVNIPTLFETTLVIYGKCLDNAMIVSL